MPCDWSLNNELFHRKIDLGIRPSFSLPLQQPILVTSSAVKGTWARLLELSGTWSQWVGGRGAGPRGQRACEGRGEGFLAGLAPMSSLILEYDSGKEIIRTKKGCTPF